MSGARKKAGAALGPDAAVLDRLHALVVARRDADPRRSHSARLLARGTRKVAQKLGEEAFEALIESVAGNGQALIGETADLLYHLVVLWVDLGVAPRAGLGGAHAAARGERPRGEGGAPHRGCGRGLTWWR